MKKKICFIMTDVVSFNILCRDQLEFFNQDESLELTLICGGDLKDIQKLKDRKVGKVVYFPFYRKPNILIDIICLFKIFVFLMINRFDLVVFSTPKALLLASIASLLAVQKNRIAIVQGRVYENYTGLKRNIFQLLDRISFACASKVIFVSNSVKEICIKEKLLKYDKCILLGEGSFNGVDTKKFFPIDIGNKNLLREKYNISKEDFLICIVGRVCEDKGILELKKIIQSVTSDDIKFLLVGSVEDNISLEIINELQQKTNFIYWPFTSEVHEVFQMSNLHLFLSHREGFGNVAIEAAACGIPTFAYDIVGVKDSVKNDVSGKHFNFKEIDSIVLEIDNLKTAVNQPYSKSALWAKENFKQEKVWSSYLNTYLNIIEKRSQL